MVSNSTQRLELETLRRIMTLFQLLQREISDLCNGELSYLHEAHKEDKSISYAVHWGLQASEELVKEAERSIWNNFEIITNEKAVELYEKGDVEIFQLFDENNSEALIDSLENFIEAVNSNYTVFGIHKRRG